MSGAAVCTAHHGRHGTYLGQCVLTGREVPRPFAFRPGGYCPTCGVALDVRRERGSRQSVALLAGTDTPHGHAQPTVALDAAELAEAIVLASRAARQERQQPQRRDPEPIDPQSTMSGRVPAVSNGRQGLGGIPEFGE